MNVSLVYDGTTLTMTLTQGGNTFTDSLVINLATLLGSSTAFVGFTGASTAGTVQTISNFSFTAGAVPTSYGLTYSQANLTGADTINVYNGTSYNGSPVTGTLTLGGITGTGGSLSVNADPTAAGTLVLPSTSTNTYTGSVTVSMAGTLEVDGSLTTATSVTVGVGATLDGVGTVPGTSVSGTLKPAQSLTAGTITTGNLSFSSGTLDINWLSTGNDEVIVNGTANLTNGHLSVNASTYNVPLGTPAITILHSTGGLGGTTFSGLAQNALVHSGSQVFQIHYTATDVTLVPILNVDLSFATTTVAEGQGFATYTVTPSGIDGGGSRSVLHHRRHGRVRRRLRRRVSGFGYHRHDPRRRSLTITVPILDNPTSRASHLHLHARQPAAGTLGAPFSATTTITDPLLVVNSVTQTLAGFHVSSIARSIPARSTCTTPWAATWAVPTSRSQDTNTGDLCARLRWWSIRSTNMATRVASPSCRRAARSLPAATR